MQRMVVNPSISETVKYSVAQATKNLCFSIETLSLPKKNTAVEPMTKLLTELLHTTYEKSWTLAADCMTTFALSFGDDKRIVLEPYLRNKCFSTILQKSIPANVQANMLTLFHHLIKDNQEASAILLSGTKTFPIIIQTALQLRNQESLYHTLSICFILAKDRATHRLLLESNVLQLKFLLTSHVPSLKVFLGLIIKLGDSEERQPVFYSAANELQMYVKGVAIQHENLQTFCNAAQNAIEKILNPQRNVQIKNLPNKTEIKPPQIRPPKATYDEVYSSFQAPQKKKLFALGKKSPVPPPPKIRLHPKEAPPPPPPPGPSFSKKNERRDLSVDPSQDFQPGSPAYSPNSLLEDSSQDDFEPGSVNSEDMEGSVLYGRGSRGAVPRNNQKIVVNSRDRQETKTTFLSHEEEQEGQSVGEGESMMDEPSSKSFVRNMNPLFENKPKRF